MDILRELSRIIHATSLIDEPIEQVTHIVESVHKAINADVCSLYILNSHNEMVLMASHGLQYKSPGDIKIPEGKGLVGLVAQSRVPLNIDEAADHPAYYYVPNTQEERYHSFCGIPLIRSSALLGVLVVQNTAQQKLSDEEEAFLVTLGAQLALVVANESQFATTVTNTQQLNGIKGAPGIGIGKLLFCDDDDLFTVNDSPCNDIPTACYDWHQLLITVREDLSNERKTLGDELGENIDGIFSAYQLLLSDEAIIKGVENKIREGHALPSAMKHTFKHYADVFFEMDDPYLRARYEDIHHLGNKLYGSWKGHSAESKITDNEPVILFGNRISVSDISSIPSSQLIGVVCIEGSSLSHTAIIANALGIPAVLGIGPQRGLRNGDSVIVDGDNGHVFLNPGYAVIQEYQNLLQKDQQFAGKLQELRDKPAITKDGTRIQLFANTGLLADISPGLKNGAEGIGLYRTEIPFMVSKTFPSENEQEKLYRQVLAAYSGKPVYMRILDIGGDKPLPYFPFSEENPALGWRGIRFCLDNSSLLITQLRAMLRAAGETEQLHISLPMISSTQELISFYELLDTAFKQLQQEGIAVVYPKVGIVLEVPAAISQLRSWGQFIDFISIGSNDLSQYLLARDRNNPRVSAGYDHVHPAVLQEILRIVDINKDLQVPLSVCGEMASEPLAALLLVGIGVRTLSMSATKLPRIKWLLNNLSMEEIETITKVALSFNDSQKIRQFGAEKLRAIDAEKSAD